MWYFVLMLLIIACAGNYCIAMQLIQAVRIRSGPLPLNREIKIKNKFLRLW
jgi:hypothetical protein